MSVAAFDHVEVKVVVECYTWDQRVASQDSLSNISIMLSK